MSKAFLIGLALLAGIFNAVESGTNATLRKVTGAPIWSVALISLIALIATSTAAVAARERFPTVALLKDVPWWGWLGGVLGIGVVAIMVAAADALGAALFIALLVTGSTIASLGIDHFGIVGFEQHSLNWGRACGGLFMIIGVSLIAMF